ncbi:putative wall-associated receptor kinase-like protein 16 [Cinnamomum micranthum f. kanehirae]|uniref:Putative wall-associated receptor kinase-like protein 16 n=1 Tax=Cinnamomum micranthum f. kanehirae TaxID=337451 RepID=A0A443NLB4_9MAGN|nr:putative wall-associated receptor kinase-like protein 16 [Cinnamomum micranthum f. kanehirae]
MVLHLLLHIFFCLFIAAATEEELRPECPTSCGNVRIPYPFGIGNPSCYRNEHFEITCNYTETHDQKPFWGEQEILDISPLGQMTIRSWLRWDCYFENSTVSSNMPYWINLDQRGPFTISTTRNKLTVVGCDSWVILTGSSSRGHNFTSGCLSYCEDMASVINGSCTGIGCCHLNIPAGVKRIVVELGSTCNHTKVRQFNPCSYSFLVDQDKFKLSVSDLYGDKLRSKILPVMIDWMAGNETCEEAQANKATYACRSENSHCNYSSNGLGYGYWCNCFSDIDECQDKKNNPCKGNCINTIGGYNCTCPKGTHGDPYKEGNGCVEDTKESPLLKVLLGPPLSKCLLVYSTNLKSIYQFKPYRPFFMQGYLAASCFYSLELLGYIGHGKKIKMIKLKEHLFQQNGGLLLQQKISSRRAESFKIFTTKELERATENYNVSRIVGRGGYGIVYKGILPDSKTIAIKKPKTVDASQIEHFINKVHILSEINHKNVVKLVGCCLEDQVPLLVYEFISNGTLYSHIHKIGHTQAISLQNRLRIATETAEALAYLHSGASTPIFHRDVKSSNILLDDNLTAKVSDFGTSKLVPIDRTKLTTLVQGTLGYLDPEYFQTGQVTAKSDVYSFGIVLVELLTGEKAISLTRSEEERNLAMHFISTIQENRLFQILEDQVLDEGQDVLLIAIAQLAKRCLNLKGEERPTMKQVVVELHGLTGLKEHHSVYNNITKTQSISSETSHGCTGETSERYSLENRFLPTLEDGR